MIDVTNLSFTYPGNAHETLTNISFSINEGEIFGFLGPSGAGKSTTQKVLIGILKGYAGSVRVMGRELSTLGSGYYENIGVAFEFPNLYSKFTAMENLSFFRALYQGETEAPMALLRLVGLEDDANTRVAAFSKGMRMRLNFVRALLNKPRIIFLDEPTSGLDPVNAKKMKEILLRLKDEGRTVFLTTHNMNVADELCDRVAFIVKGGIPLIGAPRELKIRKGKKVVRVERRDGGARAAREFELANIGENTAFLSYIKEGDVETIHTLEATLEDIFIETTGARLD